MIRASIVSSNASSGMIFVRLGVGLVFLLEGVKKFLFPLEWGVGRFTKIGIWHPTITAPFVGGVEIVCGALLLVGLFTRLAAVPLLIDITVAILTTKIPMLLSKGFWPMEAEARTDFAMLTGLLCLIIVGAGWWSADARFAASGARPSKYQTPDSAGTSPINIPGDHR
jgi:putative oxidoreductase